MTPDEALAEVRARMNGRTRYDGSLRYADEVLAEEVERLRKQVRSVDFAVALSRAAHDHMQARGLNCPHDIGIVLAAAARRALGEESTPPPAGEEPR